VTLNLAPPSQNSFTHASDWAADKCFSRMSLRLEMGMEMPMPMTVMMLRGRETMDLRPEPQTPAPKHLPQS